jgi:cyclopropane-fatty-acyl-phospholipid synthase
VIVQSLYRVFERIGSRTALRLRVQFVDGTSYQNVTGEPDVFLHYTSRAAQLKTLLYGHVGLLESYLDQTLDIDGDLHKAFEIGFGSGFAGDRSPLVWLRNQWHELRFSNRNRAQAKRNARAHYGLGDAFYRQWLDAPLLMYTCAYWPDGTRSLEEAQTNKLDHVCRKIRLAAGDRVVDIGCGFGGFMFHAAERFGAQVCGVNTTPEQVEFVRHEIERRQLGALVSVREADFRDVDDVFDKVVSIGVLEHAGRDQLDDVVRAHAAFLRPGGLGLLHFIGHVGRHDTELFIRRHVFPGGWIPSLAQTLTAMERAGLEILDVENLRRHYALTLDVWADRFEQRWNDIRGLDPTTFTERFHRVWRTYLVSCGEMFRSPKSNTHLFQITFSKGNVTRENYPMSRRHLYLDGH